MSKNVRLRNPNRRKYPVDRIWPSAYQEYRYRMWRMINFTERHLLHELLHKEQGAFPLSERQLAMRGIEEVRRYRQLSLTALH